MPAFKRINVANHSEDDIRYWKLLRNGEKSGLEGIYIKFSQDLFRYGMAVKSNRSFIKDCIQELFIDLWKYRYNLKHTDNVKVYLFRCLSNKIHKEVLKDKKRYEQGEVGTFESILLVDSSEAEMIIHQGNENLKTKLAKALEDLPIRQREVIQHLFFESHSYDDTSQIMGINVQSIYTLAWKAIANLKKSILFIIYLLINQ